MYKIVRVAGKVSACLRQNQDGSETSFFLGDSLWPEFLEWNAKQPVPLDLSDKPPEPTPRDLEREALMALLDKDGSGSITNAEKLDFCFKVCKRLARSI